MKEDDDVAAERRKLNEKIKKLEAELLKWKLEEKKRHRKGEAEKFRLEECGTSMVTYVQLKMIYDIWCCC
jgi:predicted nuclease with TOPRIM domain